MRQMIHMSVNGALSHLLRIKNMNKVEKDKKENNEPMIYESPDKGKTVYARPFGSCITAKKLIKGNEDE
jgi:hypothetical protein